MAKSIKKSLKYFIIVLGVLVALPAILYPILQISEVQTFLVNRISGQLSRDLNSAISVGKIKYRFFNRLVIDDLLVRDRNNDTLLYTSRLLAGVRRFDLEHRRIRLGTVRIDKPVIGLARDSAGTMNIEYFIDYFKSPADTSSKGGLKFLIDEINIDHGRFSLLDSSHPDSSRRLDPGNLHVNDFTVSIGEFRTGNDTTSFTIHNLDLSETSGFRIKNLNSSVSLSEHAINIRPLFIETDSSLINISGLNLRTDSAVSFSRFTEDVRINALLDKSLISLSDLSYFIKGIEGIRQSFNISGRISGTVQELRGRNILLSYGNSTAVDCDFDLSGLPSIENTFIYLGVNNLRTNAADIDVLRLQKKDALGLPEALYKLGDITFNGSFTGFTTDFVTYGELRTSEGNLRTDISLRPEKSKRYRIRGLLKGSGINLGELTGKPGTWGNLSFNTSVDGYALSLRKFSASLTGRIDSVEFTSYKYRNISLNGVFTEKTWDGSINISDNNIRMDLLGMFDFSNKLPEFDFTLNLARAKLFNLNLDRHDSTSSVAMLMTANFRGNSIDNIDGEIKLLNSSFIKYGKNLELYDLSLKTYKDRNIPVLNLHTDFADGEIRGNYNFASLGNVVSSAIASIIPSARKSTLPKNELRRNNFTFEVNFRNTDNLNNFFRTGLLLADKSFIKGSVSNDTVITVEVRSKSLNIRNNIFSNLSIEAGISGALMSFDLRSSSLTLMKKSELRGFGMGYNSYPGSFVFKTGWDNKDQELNRGTFIARGSLEKINGARGRQVLTVNIDSSEIWARNNLWKISRSSIKVDSSSVSIDKFFIRNRENYYLVDGSVSENPADTLNLEFRGIDISPLNYIGSQGNTIDPDKVFYDFRGQLNGKILLTNVYHNLLMETDLDIHNFGLLGTDFGTMSVNTELDIARKVLNIKASNNLNGARMLDIRGYYDPSIKKASVNGVATKLNVAFLNPLLKAFASGISGTASGKVNLTVQQGNIVLTGAVLAENAGVKINYLQTKYKLNDSVRFDRKGISFDNFKAADEKGNPLTLSGRVNHKSFKDFQADLTINSNESLVLNTKPKDNDLFYGTAYASGVTTIKSGNNVLAFDISAKTGKNTKFFMPLNSGLSVSEYSFITFADTKQHAETAAGQGDKVTRTVPVPASTGIDLDFDLEVTPEAEAQLIFDSKVGDVMKGHGSGNLNITYNPKGEFRITGDYIVEDGDYLFTLGNILNKSFSVENGGKIMFNGDINNAEIDMKAIYKLKASLFPILQDENYKDRIPVECQLNLSGNLWNPVVGFNIYLPTADEKTRTYVRNAISTEEELSRQFLYLLVMNSFYADPSMGMSATASATPSGTSAMAVTTFEMLSNQLSNWLSQISNDFDIGVTYRPGSGNKDMNPQEVQVALSTQIFNDKVVINGNFDVPLAGSATDNTNQITGDFDAEIKLTNRLNLKVFNRYNNPYTGKGVDYTQGIGIFFKQDFDRFSDLFKKKEKARLKKVTDTVPPKK